jgi:hypothetical protein
VHVLSEAFIATGKSSKIQFDPPIPCVSLVHVYLKGDVAACLAARDSVRAQKKIFCFASVRPCPHDCSWSYFEFNMGTENIDISDEIWLLGWQSLLEYL